MGKFVIKKRSNEYYQFNLKADNGQVILFSQDYQSKTSCEQGIVSVKTHAIEDNKYDRLTALGGQHYFNLKAANGLVIGTSEMYESTASRDKGIAFVKAKAPIASIDNQTL